MQGYEEKAKWRENYTDGARRSDLWIIPSTKGTIYYVVQALE